MCVRVCVCVCVCVCVHACVCIYIDIHNKISTLYSFRTNCKMQQKNAKQF